MKIIKNTILLISLLVGSMAYSSVGISTGGSTGTYIKIGKDLKRTCSPYLDLNVLQSKGSVQNFERIVSDSDTTFAIVQADVLALAKVEGNKSHKKIKMVYPLYNEEIHIIIRKDSSITDFSDLRHKRVVVGGKKSGSEVTAKLLQSVSGVSFDSINAGSKDGIKMLLRDEADAMIYVAGKPTKLLSALPSNTPLKLLSFRDRDISSMYKNSTISAYTYKFQRKSVKTYSVRSILVTYDYQTKSYTKKVEKLAQCLNDKIYKLKRNGHQKWKDVDLRNITTVNWPVHNSVNRYLKDKNITNNIINILDSM
jgi:TRAP transporter TAXI family solute receptor